MIVWNVSCEKCKFDLDFAKLADARREGKKHIGHHEDGQVYIDQVDTDPAPFDDYLTGKSIILK